MEWYPRKLWKVISAYFALIVLFKTKELCTFNTRHQTTKHDQLTAADANQRFL